MIDRDLTETDVAILGLEVLEGSLLGRDLVLEDLLETLFGVSWIRHHMKHMCVYVCVCVCVCVCVGEKKGVEYVLWHGIGIDWRC